MKTQHQASTAVFRVKKDAPRTRGDFYYKTLERLCVVETIAFLPFSLFVSVVLSRRDRSRCRRFTFLEIKHQREKKNQSAFTQADHFLYQFYFRKK